MKIALIIPALMDQEGNIKKYKKTFSPSLIFGLLNSLTPSKHEVKTYNDMVEEIEFSDSFDLVGITLSTAIANRAYQIADKFRELGVRVILGGIHVSLLPEESKKHADSILIGEAELLWEEVLIDAENHRLKEVYETSELFDFKRLIIPKWDNVNLDIYMKTPMHKLPIMPILTTRGCPNGCNYCTVTKLYGKSFRMKPISHVLKEIEATNAETYLFVDDNIVCVPDYSRELFKALAKKNIRWVSQASTTIVNNPDLIELAAKAGCHSLFLGLESIDEQNLKSVSKGFNKVNQYSELFSKLYKEGIMVMAGLIVGFDFDTKETIEKMIKFLLKNKILIADFSILTPLPGSKLFEDYDREGRILHYDWSKYDLSNVVFTPKNFTPEELYDYYWEEIGEFNSFKNILKRLWYGCKMKTSTPIQDFIENLFMLFGHRNAVRDHEQFTAGGFGKYIKSAFIENGRMHEKNI